ILLIPFCSKKRAVRYGSRAKANPSPALFDRAYFQSPRYIAPPFADRSIKGILQGGLFQFRGRKYFNQLSRARRYSRSRYFRGQFQHLHITYVPRMASLLGRDAVPLFRFVGEIAEGKIRES